MTEIIIALEKIESEVHNLKMKLKAQAKPIKLQGIWKGVEISEKEVKEVRKSLFKNAYKFDTE